MNAVTIVRRLLAAGWRTNSYTEMADDSVIVDGTRGGSTVTAVIGDDGTTGLTLTGLTAEQVAAALIAVGHMPAPVDLGAVASGEVSLPRLPKGWNSSSRAALGIIRRQDDLPPVNPLESEEAAQEAFRRGFLEDDGDAPGGAR